MVESEVQIDLSPIEKRILEMIVGNMSPSEIAFALDVELPTVVETSENIFNKLKVRDARSAIEIALKLNLVKLEP